MKTCPLLDLCSLKQADRSGFTLVELFVVVFILSTLALTGLALTETADSQLRFEDTQARLRALKRAVIGDTEPVFDGRRLLSGFVVDNGLLPDSLQTLSTPVILFAEDAVFGNKLPVFDPRPDADGLNDGNVSEAEGEDEVVLGNPKEILFKGFRGPYINIRAGTDSYRDGWGNVNALDAVDDDQNYGWRLDVPPLGDGLRITSFGSDGLPDDDVAPIDEVYGHDLPMQIDPQDWQVDLGTLTATVLNETGQDVPSPGDGDLRICVLVYFYDTSDPGAPVPRWKRINGTLSSTPIPSGGEATFTFPANAFVPIGRHLALLISDPDGDENSGDEEPFESPGSEERVSAQVSFYPRTYPQPLTLSIR